MCQVGRWVGRWGDQPGALGGPLVGIAALLVTRLQQQEAAAGMGQIMTQLVHHCCCPAGQQSLHVDMNVYCGNSYNAAWLLVVPAWNLLKGWFQQARDAIRGGGESVRPGLLLCQPQWSCRARHCLVVQTCELLRKALTFANGGFVGSHCLSR
jgi:hypothetical protein